MRKAMGLLKKASLSPRSEGLSSQINSGRLDALSSDMVNKGWTTDNENFLPGLLPCLTMIRCLREHTCSIVAASPMAYMDPSEPLTLRKVSVTIERKCV